MSMMMEIGAKNRERETSDRFANKKGNKEKKKNRIMFIEA